MLRRACLARPFRSYALYPDARAAAATRSQALRVTSETIDTSNKYGPALLEGMFVLGLEQLEERGYRETMTPVALTPALQQAVLAVTPERARLPSQLDPANAAVKAEGGWRAVVAAGLVAAGLTQPGRIRTLSQLRIAVQRNRGAIYKKIMETVRLRRQFVVRSAAFAFVNDSFLRGSQNEAPPDAKRLNASLQTGIALLNTLSKAQCNMDAVTVVKLPPGGKGTSIEYNIQQVAPALPIIGTPLTELVRLQARALGTRGAFEGMPDAVVYTKPAARAAMLVSYRTVDPNANALPAALSTQLDRVLAQALTLAPGTTGVFYLQDGAAAGGAAA